MRACIPSQLIMFTFIIETLNKTNKPKIIQYTLIILICLGTITPINEITRTIKNINNKTTEKIDLTTDVKSDNFYGYKEDNLFVKYIAKHK